MGPLGACYLTPLAGKKKSLPNSILCHLWPLAMFVLATEHMMLNKKH